MENELLVLGLLEHVLGKGKGSKTNSDYAFHCPICKHKNPKLIINIKSGQYNCWTCEIPTKGKTPVSLFKKLQVDIDKIQEMKSYFKNDNINIQKIVNTNKAILPKEFISLTKNDNSLDYRQAISYIKQRGITLSDIVKYNIGYCKSGKYKNRIIIPSYNRFGDLNYFVGRSYEKEPGLKYDAPSVDKKSIIGMEYFINWSTPIILCEGALDAIAIKRNAIPLFGKVIPDALMMKLVQTQVKTVYLALDNDVIKLSLNYAEQLLNLGKEVYLIELEGKDPSKLGFEKMTKLLHTAKPFTFADIILKRLVN